MILFSVRVIFFVCIPRGLFLECIFCNDMNFNSRFIFLCSVMALLLALVACKSESARPEKNVAVEKSQQLPKTESESFMKIKVRKVLGETDYRRQNSETWKKLRYGQNVLEKDRIRTAIESEAILGALDGSTIWIKENSDVFIDAEFLKKTEKNFSVTVLTEKYISIFRNCLL